MLEDNVLPRKGRWTQADRERETGTVFRAARQQHPAVVLRLTLFEAA